MNTRIISGMLLCCEEKANQMQNEKKNASYNLQLLTLWLVIFDLLSDWSWHN